MDYKFWGLIEVIQYRGGGAGFNVFGMFGRSWSQFIDGGVRG